MKYFIGFILFAFLSSCCKQKDCLTGHITEIDLASYSASDIDTIVVRRFIKASDFQNLVDTVILNQINSRVYPNGDTTRVHLYDTSVALKATYDYEIYIPATRTVAKVSNIVAPQMQHQVCLFCDCVQGPCYNPVISFTLDGQPVSSDYVTLKK
ncbi:MAG TPA: hypothetical protein VFT78_01500 [Hanamia sp.]|jgi:hypothetical protein|nr:hypothetical protein [Hanamia sp.]